MKSKSKLLLAVILGFSAALTLPTRAEAPRLKVLTLNTWFLSFEDRGLPALAEDLKARLHVMPKAIAATGADVVSFQEVWNEQYRRVLIRALRKEGYSHFAYDSGKRPGFNALRGTLGNGLLVASRYPISEKIDRLDFTSYTRPDEYFARKGAIHLEIEVPGHGWVDYYNSHVGAVSFDAKAMDYDPRHTALRFGQVRELVSFIERTRRRPVQILTVDGNFHHHLYDSRARAFSPDALAPEYELLTKGLGLLDSFHEVNGFTASSDGTPGGTYDPKFNFYAAKGLIQDLPSEYVDYVFAGSARDCVAPRAASMEFTRPIRASFWDDVSPLSGDQLVDLKRIDKEVLVSDHFGVMAELELKPGC